MVKAIEEKLGFPINVSEDAHFIGAIGGALFALERAQAAALLAQNTVSQSAAVSSPATAQ